MGLEEHVSSSSNTHSESGHVCSSSNTPLGLEEHVSSTSNTHSPQALFFCPFFLFKAHEAGGGLEETKKKKSKKRLGAEVGRGGRHQSLSYAPKKAAHNEVFFLRRHSRLSWMSVEELTKRVTQEDHQLPHNATRT